LIPSIYEGFSFCIRKIKVLEVFFESLKFDLLRDLIGISQVGEVVVGINELVIIVVKNYFIFSAEMIESGVGSPNFIRGVINSLEAC
jgi:hypothetical protein